MGKMVNYIITGHDKAGKRFSIFTTNPQHFNIWRGTLWESLDELTPTGRNKRKLIKYYF